MSLMVKPLLTEREQRARTAILTLMVDIREERDYARRAGQMIMLRNARARLYDLRQVLAALYSI